MLGEFVTVTVDRPIGSRHPKYNDLVYPINYGYVEGIIAPDGEEQDAYIIGVNTPVTNFTGKVIAVVHRKNDIEDKWVVSSDNTIYTKRQICDLISFQERYFDTTIVCLYE